MTKLLIVDDNEQNLYLLRALLEGNGYEVVSAKNGAEALEKARSDPPDLVISDILMPVMDGFSLCREWKSDGGLKGIPFVVYTATYTDTKDEKLALSLGAEKFLVKPMEPDKFVAIVRKIIEKPDEDRLAPASEPPVEEAAFLEDYSKALVRKLEDKVFQLEASNRALELEITDREQTDKALRESEEQYRHLVDFLPIPMFQTDDKGILIFANKAFFEKYEYPEAILEKEFDCFQTLIPEDRYRASNILSKVMNDNDFGGTEYTAITKNGVKFPVIVYTSRVSFKNKTIQHGVVIDITKRKQAEAEKERLIDKLKDALSEVEKLSGLLPICSSCKKIRDDRGHWNQIESYIQEHSDAKFSHSICPDCAKKLYPELFSGD